MKNYKLLALMILILTFFSYAAKNISAAELVTNGGFETGTFTGWSVTNVTTNIWFNWSVTGPNCNACASQWTNGTSPHTGNFDAWNGWAAGNPVPSAYFIRQDITIPNNPNEFIRLRWWDRLQWDLQTFTTPTGSTLPQFRIVNILNPANNAVLQEIHRFTAPAFSRGPMLLAVGQGWVQYDANLSAYKGQTIRLEFRCTVAQDTIGPGFCEFDDISLTNYVPTSATVSVGGRITSANGRGIGKVSVSATDSEGGVHTAITNPFGYYSFEEVAVGVITVSAAAKRYTFANPTQVMYVSENVGNVDFAAIE